MGVDKNTNPQMYEMVLPINPKYIKPPAPGKHGRYIPHWVISQAIMLAVGHYDFEIRDIMYGFVPAHQEHPELPNAVVGVMARMTVEVDGRRVSVDEVGSCDAAGFEHNDAERLKKATSDALKRCAMRLGVGLQMWCKTPAEFFLPRVMHERATVEGSPDPEFDTDVVVDGEESDDG